MISTWLEKLSEDGVIRPHVKEAIYDDCVALIQSPESMPKTASEALAIGGALSMEKVGETLADALILLKVSAVANKQAKPKIMRRPPPRGANLRDLGRMTKNIGILGSVALMGGIGTGAVKHLISMRERSKLEKGLNASFDAAMRMSDPQKDALHKDPEKAREAFNALAHFAPHVAIQPAAAKSFMDKLVNYNMTLQATDAKDLSEIERNLAQARGEHPAFISGFSSGVEAFGLNRAAGETYKNALS